MRAQCVKQARQLRRIIKSWRAATPMHLRHAIRRLAPCQQFGLHADFSVQVVKVLPRLCRVSRRDLVARAVVAQRGTERQVHINRQRPPYAARIAPPRRGLVLTRGKPVAEAIRRGVRRIARPAAIQAMASISPAASWCGWSSVGWSRCPSMVPGCSWRLVRAWACTLVQASSAIPPSPGGSWRDRKSTRLNSSHRT